MGHAAAERVTLDAIAAEDEGVVFGCAENEWSGTLFDHIFDICKVFLTVEEFDAVVMIPVAGNEPSV